MKLYYYIHTGHRFGLDRLRRGAVLYKQMLKEGIEAQVLLNDYRATIVAKELGIVDSTAVDSMFNIPSIAEAGDGLIIDTPELTDDILAQMCHYFRTVVNFSNEGQKFSEKVISQVTEDANSVQCLLIDPKYFQNAQKSSKTLLFYGDEDYEKNLLKDMDRFKNCDLLLGHYFFLDYEKQLAKGFGQIHEDYNCITEYECVVSRSLQTVLEAGASGAKVCYIGDEVLSLVTLQKILGLKIANSSQTPITGDLAGPIEIERLKKLSLDLNYRIIFSKLGLDQFKFK